MLTAARRMRGSSAAQTSALGQLTWKSLAATLVTLVAALMLRNPQAAPHFRRVIERDYSITPEVSSPRAAEA